MTRGIVPASLMVCSLFCTACDDRRGDLPSVRVPAGVVPSCTAPSDGGPCRGSKTSPSRGCLYTCESTQSTCGSVCGTPCGTCPDDLTCLEGKCLGPLSCEDCGLQLAVRESTSSETVEVEVRFAPAESDPRPRMIDLRVRPSRPVRLLAAESGPAMLQAEMTFRHDAASNEAWKHRADGSYQLLIGGYGSAHRLEAGLLATLRFERDSVDPLSFALEKRAQTFAPLSADAALQATPYGRAAAAR